MRKSFRIEAKALRIPPATKYDELLLTRVTNSVPRR
jgi:hypothetical protein